MSSDLSRLTYTQSSNLLSVIASQDYAKDIRELYSDYSPSEYFIREIVSAKFERDKWLDTVPHIKELIGKPIVIECASNNGSFFNESAILATLHTWKVEEDYFIDNLSITDNKVKYHKHSDTSERGIKITKVLDIMGNTALRQSYMEWLGKLNTKAYRTFYLTDNIMHYLTASEWCSYNSCFRLDGEYHQGAIGCARTPQVLMLVEIDKSKSIRYGVPYKVSRAWCMFNEDGSIMSVPKLYSSFGNVVPTTTSLADKLGTMLWGEVHNSCDLLVNYEGNFYEDSSLVRGKEPDLVDELYISVGMYLDGEDAYDGRLIQGAYCGYCDEFHEYEYLHYVDSYDGGRDICEYCFNDSFFVCADCGEYHHEDYANYCESYNDNICTDCYENGNYAFCEVTGDLYHTDDMIYVECDGVYVCSNAYDDNYFGCSECDTVYNNDDYDSEYDCCTDCADRKREEEDDED